jgi:hypothetical protein
LTDSPGSAPGIEAPYSPLTITVAKQIIVSPIRNSRLVV